MKLDLEVGLCTRCGVLLPPTVGVPHPDAADAIPVAKLTRSERRVFLLLCKGFSNKQISDRLVVSGNTVRFHLKQVYAKLGARSRAHAVALGSGASLDVPVLE
ncbi:hypothetical protein B1810_23665 [Panacagrimonas perspica]|uniref:helix-turn-helix domain-containing protein n=1 Tax=Panacagrimonas perspica TaxID=381431 RepID=UPI00105F92D9|nr:helix-turn-helix transcriptional regulator [Panacagrimonas perspica]THD00683.1 hypothetical protein B1810_23665 [Panacagrimonas perspica]